MNQIQTQLLEALQHSVEVYNVFSMADYLNTHFSNHPQVTLLMQNTSFHTFTKNLTLVQCHPLDKNFTSSNPNSGIEKIHQFFLHNNKLALNVSKQIAHNIESKNFNILFDLLGESRVQQIASKHIFLYR